VVPVAAWGGFQQATDWVEYDIAFARDSLLRGCYYSPVKGNASKPYEVFFRRGDGLDQFGREQSSGPEPQGGAGAWEHRVVGLCSFAPGPLGQHALVFTGGKPGTFKVWIDNLRIRRADGSVSPVWIDAKDTRSHRVEDSVLFTDVLVRAIPVTKVAGSGDSTK
jgi:hypothetical protein